MRALAGSPALSYLRAMTTPRSIELVEDPRFRDHVSPAGHPERPERLHAVSDAIRRYEDRLERLALRPAEPDEILRVHDAAHLAHVAEVVASAPAKLDPDTFVSTDSYEVALLAAGSTSDLVRRVARGETQCGVAAIRPPGHHAEQSRAMGFCLFNNVAIAARALQAEEGLDKILILDWDVHHGNGTQHSFEADPSILYISTHQFPHYPGTGDFGEVGLGAGEGTTVNVPLPAGSGDAELVGALQRVLAPVARRFRPDMILVSCGFDAHRDDPLASLEVTGAGYLAMTHVVRALAEEVCGGRLAFVLEGGYAASGLIEGTTALLEGVLTSEPGAAPPSPEAPAGSILRGVIDQVAAAQARWYPDIDVS
jgi:acetoin utilization deacetylase AcuC-like enzyme